MRSSPSRGALRGNASSSRPSRQTMRCGTERIGTSVQMVRWPVRKFARVGRPCSRSASSARTSSSVSATSFAPASATTSPRMRSSCARCQASRWEVAVRASAAVASAWAHSATGLGVPKASTAVCRRSTSSAIRPARSMARLSTSSTGSTPSNSRWPSSVIVTPTSTRSSPAFQVPAARSCSL